MREPINLKSDNVPPYTGGGVSTTKSVDDAAWEQVVLLSGKRVMDFDFNTSATVPNAIMRQLTAALVADGAVQPLSFRALGGGGLGGWRYLVGGRPPVDSDLEQLEPFEIVIDGTLVVVDRVIDFTIYRGNPTPTSYFIWLETWAEEVQSLASTVDPTSRLVYVNGNTNDVGSLSSNPPHQGTGPAPTLTNDLGYVANPDSVPVETSRRIQRRWRVRCAVADFAASPFGFGYRPETFDYHPDAPRAQGGLSAPPTSGYVFQPADAPPNGNEDPTFDDRMRWMRWRAGDGTAAAAQALNTVDGYVLAVPIAEIFHVDGQHSNAGLVRVMLRSAALRIPLLTYNQDSGPIPITTI